MDGKLVYDGSVSMDFDELCVLMMTNSDGGELFKRQMNDAKLGLKMCL